MGNTPLLAFGLVLLCGCSSVRSTSSAPEEGAKKIWGLPLISTPDSGILLSFGFDETKYELGDGKASIDDLAEGAKAGYRIVAVDGKKERRMAHPFITYIPFVAVAPGRHEITLEKSSWPERGLGPVRISFMLDFVEGEHYILRRNNNFVYVTAN